MTYTLAIDTSQGTSVAILSDLEVLSEHTETSPMRHAEQIGSLIKLSLQEAKIQPQQVSRVVVGIGPAPFTGLRVGIAAAKFFAAGSGAKLYSVSSLDAIAFGLNLEMPTLVYTDARRGEVYFSLYQAKSKSLVPVAIQGPGVMPLAALEKKLQGENIQFQKYSAAVSAGQVGKLFLAMLSEGSQVEGAVANYLRAPDAVPSSGKRVSG